MTETEARKLLELAEGARAFSYSPYSGFCVGAAILTESGKIFTGCNVENASFGATICAERTAALKAVSEGERRFTALAVVGGRKDAPCDERCAPCGMCRQFLSEFVNPKECMVILGTSEGSVDIRPFAEYLPFGFTNLEE